MNKTNTEKSNLIKFETSENTNTCKIVKVDEIHKKIYVDFDGNPTNEPLVARLSLRLSLEDLRFAKEKNLDATVFFEEDDKTKPVIDFIDFSTCPFEDEKRDIYIKGNKIIFEVDESLTFKTGDDVMKISATNGDFRVEANNISMNAKGNNIINGSVIKLN